MSLDDVSHPEFIAKSSAMAGAFTPERYAHLLSLLPTPERFTELNSRLEANYPAVLKGDPEKVKEFEADRKAVNCDFSVIVGLARVVAIKDATVPESLGLGHVTEKTTGATAPLSTPHGFKVIFDPKGRLFASVTKVPGAKGYQVWACDGDPSIEANWKLIASSTSCKGIAIIGLNRAKFNVLKIRAMRGKSASPWSNWVSLDSNS